MQLHSKFNPFVPEDLEPLSPRVLVAEDDEDFAEMIAETLEDLGCAVEVVHSGRSFGRILDDIERGLDEGFDLVVTDIQMPGGSGLASVERLRRIDWATPVVVFSAFMGLEAADEALRLGAAAVLRKPFELEHLRHTVAPLLPQG